MSATVPPDEYAFIAELYDHVPLYAGRPDVDFYVDAATASGGPVLELGCGTGRVLLPTARAGISIVGLDASPGMLRVLRQRLAGEPDEVRGRVTLVEGDMRAFELGRRVSLVTIPFRPFQHLLTVDDQLACLSCVHRHLEDAGLLAFDLFNPSLDALVTRPLGEEIAGEPQFTMSDGRHVERRHRIVDHDRFAQVNQVELVYYVTHPDGRGERLVHAFGMRYLFRYEVEHLLARSGFAVEHLYAGFDRRPYGSTYPGDLIIVARKVRGAP
jgi:SAM-dependent methyltransferase